MPASDPRDWHFDAAEEQREADERRSQEAAYNESVERQIEDAYRANIDSVRQPDPCPACYDPEIRASTGVVLGVVCTLCDGACRRPKFDPNG